MVVVDVQGSGEQPVLGQPRRLFERFGLSDAYDMSPDGQRFVMIDKSQASRTATQLNLVINWSEELKQLVPTN